MSLIAMTAVGFSFYNLYEQWQDAEGKKDHIAVIRISGEMGTGSETGDGTVIATALAKAYNNPMPKQLLSRQSQVVVVPLTPSLFTAR